jgi:hypothetical protein
VESCGRGPDSGWSTPAARWHSSPGPWCAAAVHVSSGVKNGPDALEMGCLYYPRKQTSVSYAADCDDVACYGAETICSSEVDWRAYRAGPYYRTNAKFSGPNRPRPWSRGLRHSDNDSDWLPVSRQIHHLALNDLRFCFSWRSRGRWTLWASDAVKANSSQTSRHFRKVPDPDMADDFAQKKSRPEAASRSLR